MILNVYVDEQLIPVKIPDFVMQTGEAFYRKMDADMDRGWQMSRDWIDHPNLEQRCQIVADRLLTAIENDNQKFATMMAGYLIARAPQVRTVRVATNGEIQETELLTAQDEYAF